MTLSDPQMATAALPATSTAPAAEDATASIERLPKWLLCVPIGVQLLWQGILHRSLTLPSVLNPAIENGGLVGESKFSYLRLIGAAFKDLVAFTTLVSPGEDVVRAQARSGLSYPLIAKPDIGWCGYGVRRIDTERELQAYAAAFPPAAFLLQELAFEPNEAGIHYERRPGANGRIVALTIRHPPAVIGDGRQTVSELIAANARTGAMHEFYQRLLPGNLLARVPRRGERIVLMTVASVRVGGRYEDATDQVTPLLTETIDGLCRSMGGFEYGRLDVRFDTLEALRGGRFKVIEINGAGSEAIQCWDPKLSMTAAFAGVFAKQRELFALAHELRGMGRKPVGVRAVLRAHFKQQALIRLYPHSN